MEGELQKRFIKLVIILIMITLVFFFLPNGIFANGGPHCDVVGENGAPGSCAVILYAENCDGAQWRLYLDSVMVADDTTYGKVKGRSMADCSTGKCE
jgi:hypothetical protein